MGCWTRVLSNERNAFLLNVYIGVPWATQNTYMLGFLWGSYKGEESPIDTPTGAHLLCILLCTLFCCP